MKGSMHAREPGKTDDLVIFSRVVTFLAILTGLLYMRAVTEKGLLVVQGGQIDGNVAGRFALFLGATAALLLALRRQAVGGLLAVVVGLALGLFIYLTTAAGGLVEAVFYSSPFLVAGSLSLFCSRRQRSGP